MNVTRVVPALVIALLNACDATGPTSVRRIGVLVHYGVPSQVVASDTVDAGVPFAVSVRTYGGGCESLGDTEVEIAGSVVSLRPYDFTVRGGGACTDILNEFSHDVTVVMATPGPLELRVHGLELPADTMIVIERQLFAH